MTGEKFHFSQYFSFRNIARHNLPLSVGTYLIFKSFPVLMYQCSRPVHHRSFQIKENPNSLKYYLIVHKFLFSLFLLNIFDHGSHFSFKSSKMVTTASPTQTIQEGNQKEIRLLVTSSPISNDNGTRFAPKSLLDAAIKLFSAPCPINPINP